jgi:hypothetical protein
MSAVEKPTRAAVVNLLRAEREWRRFFQGCCKAGLSRLWASSYQFRDEIQKRGEWHTAEESLAEHYAGLSEGERARLNIEAQDEFCDRINLAGEENAPATFPWALARLERAGLDAFEAVQSAKGAVA